ncbi:MAG TPA: argininosuccinate lyase [Burkholderiaceae bacterium]|nr:argininosuccinate lyase [Burkholderiaceae bacterium]
MAHNPLDKKSQAWSALFSEPMDALVQRYTASVGFDHRLWRADIAGSLAHARMLAAQQVITAQDLADIERGLAQIAQEIESGAFEWKLELEDVHLNIEARLTQLVGDAGKRLHTGRSRNDQVATDLRLWLRGEIDALATLLAQMQRSLLDVAAAHTETVMPGFTHLQVAQPVSFAHHLLAYVEMFARDAQRLADVRKRTNQLPLGAAALAGTSYPLDRQAVARELGFDGVCENSLDAVSDRDFAIEFAAFAAIAMVHVSRLAEEIVLWMSQNFGFIDLADRYCTGSSIMPQKRNPDVAELARGKSGRVVGHLMSLITLMKGQPLTYNKDNQEDKEPLFDTVDTLAATLRIMAEMVGGLQVKPEAMRAAATRGYATATDLADHLVRCGVAFRDAHEVVAQAVKLAMQRGVDLAGLPSAELRSLHPAIGDDAQAALTLQGSLRSRTSQGGTAPQRVREQIERHRRRLASAG